MRSVVLQQKEERDALLRKVYQKRILIDHVEQYLASDLIKLITGPRRAGKSVFALQLLGSNDFAYLNFDDELLLSSFDENAINIEELEIPLSRKLIVIKGNYETIKNELTKIEDKNSWIEVHISDDNAMYANNEIRQLASKLELTLLAVKIDKSEKQLKANELKVISLDELSVEQVFEKRLELENIEDKEFEKELLLNFKEVVSKVQSL